MKKPPYAVSLEGTTPQERAKSWLQQMFEGSKCSSIDIETLQGWAKDDGIRFSLARKARKELGIVSVAVDGEWFLDGEVVEMDGPVAKWLLKALKKAGGTILESEIYVEAEKAGISDDQLRNVRRSMRVKSRAVAWEWRVSA